jgi:hypothetical protein
VRLLLIGAFVVILIAFVASLNDFRGVTRVDIVVDLLLNVVAFAFVIVLNWDIPFNIFFLFL